MLVTALSFLGALARISDPAQAPLPGLNEWTEVARATPSDRVKILLVLKRDPEALEKLEQTFWEVSDPTNEKYGQHLTQEEITELLAVPAEQLKAVTDFLEQNGATVDVGAHKDLVSAELPVESIETMFNVDLFTFQHTVREEVSIVRTKEAVTLPDALGSMISIVDNLEGFPVIRTEPVIVEIPEFVEYDSFPAEYNCNGQCPNMVTPGVLLDRYKLGNPIEAGRARGSMAVAEFQGVYWSQNQLNTFGQYCQVDAKVDKQLGGNEGSYCDSSSYGSECTEALLDIEYIRAVAGAVPLTDVYSNGYSLLNWAKSLEDMSNPPLVNSVSYGNDEVQQSSRQYMEECNVEFQKLGVRGISVLFASGDQGVWGRSGYGSRYHPDFPAGSPYVTAVGGTDFAQQGVIGDEKAWTDGGGGFSDTFSTPSYQAAFVQRYKSQRNLPAQSKWNANGRGYPDVSALAGLGNPYCVRTGGRFAGVGGTSASCPVFAGVVAKLNEIRLGKGQSPLGFLNPWLYQNADGFNDVKLGNNGGGYDSGFPATEGWDAATGLGTPNFEILQQRV